MAKMGSDYKKPDAVTVVTRDFWREHILPLKVSDLMYIGRSTTLKLNSIGIFTIGQLATASQSVLKAMFGVAGKQMWLHDITIMPNTSTANFSTEKPEPNRSIVVNNEKWCQTKSVSKAPDGTIISTTDFVLTEFGETKKQTTYTYNDGVVTEG